MKLFAVITLFQLGAFCAYATEPVINLKEIVEKSIHTKKGKWCLLFFHLY